MSNKLIYLLADIVWNLIKIPLKQQPYTAEKGCVLAFKLKFK